MPICQIVGIQCHVARDVVGLRSDMSWWNENSGRLSHPTGWLRVGGVIGNQIWEFPRLRRYGGMDDTNTSGYSCRVQFQNCIYKLIVYCRSNSPGCTLLQDSTSLRVTPNLRANHPRWRKKKRRRILSSFSSSCPVPHCLPHPESQLNPKAMSLILFKVVSNSMTEQKSPNVSSQWDYIRISGTLCQTGPTSFVDSTHAKWKPDLGEGYPY